MSIPQQAIPQQQAVQQPVQSSDEAIGSFARDFLNDLDTNTDPNQNGEQQEPEQQTEAVEPEQQEAETPPLETEPTVEVENEGKKANVPEWVKHRMMADKDYRQKTMEVAAERKELSAMKAKVAEIAQQAQQMAPYHAQLFQMDNHANYLDQQLRSPEVRADPLEFNRVQGELAILLRNRDSFAQGLHQQTDRLNHEQNQLRLKQLQLDAPKLIQEFPDLAKPETQQKLAKYVVEAGLPPEALDFLNYSAAGTKLAWKAHQYDVMVADQAKAQAKLKETVRGLPSATPSSRTADRGALDTKSLRAQLKKDNGSINSPAFTQLLRGHLKGK